MITKKDCIFIFNAMIRGEPISFENKLISLLSDYLTEINFEKADKIINLVVSNPQLMQQALPKLVEYYCRKYNIYSLKIKPDLNSLFINNFKTILYYE